MNYSSNDTVFVSGKVSYDKELSKEMASEMDKMMRKGCKIIVGDAPGADTRVQEYMASKGYKMLQFIQLILKLEIMSVTGK